jgi:3-phosphoglycerate kinase
MKKATLSLLAKHLNPASQVVMRADFNVPIKDGKITDANRIKSNHHLIKAQSPPSTRY